ncbi:MAG: cation ABC transporter substrate-binding protein [Actinomycetota bacterium]|nr:MAG: cation ABC transporter substrate-binding protein [Actinomycetota bacterium]
MTHPKGTATPNRAAVGGVLAGLAVLAASCGTPASTSPSSTLISAVGAESVYANVIAQIGGSYVHVDSIQNNPNTDPHSFEASSALAREISSADLIVRNGAGYDDWASKMIAASPNPLRKVVNVQTLLKLPDNIKNPHLWYNPNTMPSVAKAVATDLSVLQPSNASYFSANLAAFNASLQPWKAEIAKFRTDYANTPVAVSEPVADYLLQAAGCEIKTPFSLEAAIMGGGDPSPQDVTLQDNLFSNHQVKVFVYNQQVTDTLTQSFQNLAKKNGIPIIGVYETMPTNYNYQSWMMAETVALEKAVADNLSTTKL